LTGGEALSKNSRLDSKYRKKFEETIPLDHPTASDCDQILHLTGLLHSHYIFQVQKFLLQNLFLGSAIMKNEHKISLKGTIFLILIITAVTSSTRESVAEYN
jgi:hypothetical protein